MRAGALDEGAQHGRAAIDCVHLDGWIFREQTRGEAAIAVSQDKSTVRGTKLGKKGAAASPEKRAEAE
jgi:hypothetical protein